MDAELSMIAPFLDERGRLTAFPAKNRKRLAALWYLAQKVQPGREYTELEINDILDEWTTFHDPATLRRELYNKHLLDRTADCRAYRRETDHPSRISFHGICDPGKKAERTALKSSGTNPRKQRVRKTRNRHLIRGETERRNVYYGNCIVW